MRNHETSTAMISLLLPHLDAFHNHLPLVFPCWIPILLCIPKVPSCSGTLVHPRLTAQTILEPAIGATNSHAEDEIEVLVEGCRVIASLAPWVNQPCPIRVGQGKVPTLPQWLVEVCIQDLKQAGVDVCEEVLFAPLQAEGVEFFAKGSV